MWTSPDANTAPDSSASNAVAEPPGEYHRDLTGWHSRRRKQVEHIGADLRWIRIPLALPMAVDFPAGARKPVVPSAAPLVNRLVRRPKAAVRAHVGDRRDRPGGRCGAHEIVPLHEWPVHLRAHFEPNRPIPIDRNVPPP